MSLYSYQVFDTAAKTESFAKTASLLHVSPSAVSHAIADLEAELGFPLFLRDKKSITLTEGGQQMHKYVKDILATQRMMELRVSQLREATAGIVKLGLVNSTTYSWLEEIVHRFSIEHPHVELHFQENTYQKLIDDVISQELEMAVVSHTSIRDVSFPLQFIPLYNDRIVCVSKDPIPTELGEFLSVEKLNGRKLVLARDGDESDVTAYLRKQSVDIQCTCTAITDTSLVSLVRCGFGTAVLSELSLSCCDCSGLYVYPLVPMGFRTLGIISRDPRFLTPAGRDLIKCIREVGGQKQ